MLIDCCTWPDVLKELKTVTSIQRSFVEDQSVLNIISAVAHHSHSCILAGRELLKIDDLDGFGFHHGPLRISQQVHQRVDTIPLVVANSTWGGKKRMISAP